MHTTYPMGHRFMAYFLLVSLFLQSCYNPNTPTPSPVGIDQKTKPGKINLFQEELSHLEKLAEGRDVDRQERPINLSTLQASANPTPQQKASMHSSQHRYKMSLLQEQQALQLGQPARKQDKSSLELEKEITTKIFTTKQGEEVSFYQEGGKWKAKVKEKLGAFSRELLFPVYFEGYQVPTILQPSDIHIIYPQKANNSMQGYVYLGKCGLLGGMERLTSVQSVSNHEVEKEQQEVFDNEEELESITQMEVTQEAIYSNKLTTDKGTCYEIFPSITVEIAQEVQDQTGLVIPFEPGKNTTEYIGGRGNFGELRLGKDQGSGKYYGIKILKPSESALKTAREEAKLQGNLSGLPCLMPLVDIAESKDEQGNSIIYQIMPLAGLGNGAQLAAYLRSIKDKPFKEAILTHIAKGILQGFTGMHGLQQPVVHLDFKPNNLVVDSKGEVYIIDFGCAKELPGNGKISSNADGDSHYFSPERENATTKFLGKGADNWAIGLTMLELSIGMLSEKAKNKIKETRSKYAGYLMDRKLIPSNYKKVVMGFLNTEIQNRLTVEDAINMEIFQQATKSEVLSFLKEFVQTMQSNKKREEIRKAAQEVILTSVQQLPLAHFSGYVRRPELENAVIDRLINGNQQVVACVGMGGVGKTQLLTYLVHQEQLKQNFRKICWFQAADNENSLLIQYHGLAQELKLVDDKSPYEKSKAKLLAWLEEDSDSKLLVYDNANDPEVLKSFLPRNGNNKILVSSRPCKHGWDNKVEVNVFTTAEEVEQLLIKLLPDRKTSLEEAKLLGETMGYLPLALNQAIALIRQEQTSVGAYIGSYQKKSNELFARNTQLYGKDLPHSMVTLYQLQVDKLEEEQPEALHLLEYSAMLAPDNIPLSLLGEEILGEGIIEEVYKEAQQALIDYGFWQKDKQVGSVRMHRLIQQVIKLPLVTNILQTRFVSIAKRIKVEYWKKNTALVDEARRKVLLPHMEALQELAEEHDPLNKHVQFANLVDCIAHYSLYQYRNATKTIALYQRAIPLMESHYGTQHVDVAKSRTILGAAYTMQGDGKQATEALEQALPILKSHYGAKHPDVAKTLVNLGNAYGKLGDYRKQKDRLESALTMQEEYDNSSKDSFLLSTTLVNLGDTYASLEDYPKAKETLKRALDIKKSIYPENHPSTALNLLNLADVYINLKKAIKAKALLEKAFPILKSHYGEKHSLVAIAQVSLGVACGETGDNNTKKQLIEEALPILESSKNRQETAKALAHLGKTYSDLENYLKAKDLLQQALHIKEECYGTSHLEVAKTLNSLGKVYEAMNDKAEAIKHYQNAYTIFENSGDTSQSSVIREKIAKLTSKFVVSRGLLLYSSLAVVGLTLTGVGFLLWKMKYKNSNI